MFLGIDIGGTNIKAGVLDSNNRLSDIQSLNTEAEKGYYYVLYKITDLIKTFIDNNNILSIGIGVPGVVTNDGIIKIAPNLPSWNDINLIADIGNYISIPIAIDNDANAAALAEMQLGAGAGFTDFIYITMGTGIGGAIITEHKIFRGTYGSAGEIGHTIIDCANVNSESGTGTLEGKCGKNAILNYAKQQLMQNPSSLLNQIKDFEVKSISECAEKGDETSLKILQDIGYYLGIGLASAMNLLDMDKVVIGGGISLSHHAMFDSAMSVIRERTLPNISQNAVIRKAHFGNEAGTIGAALLGKRFL